MSEPGGGEPADVVRLRSAGRSDALQVAHIYVRSWNVGFGDLMPVRSCDADLVARWERDLGAGGDWRAATVGETVVGFAGTGPSRDPVVVGLAELHTIAVDPAWWRAGIGSRLMADAVARMEQAGYPRAVLWTVAGYRRGRAFYERTGWRASGEVRDGGRQLAFRRDLSPASPH